MARHKLSESLETKISKVVSVTEPDHSWGSQEMSPEGAVPGIPPMWGDQAEKQRLSEVLTVTSVLAK